MPGDTCDRTCACSHTCKISSTNQKSPVPASLSSVQSYMPNRNFIVATATLVTVTFRFHNSSLSCFVLNETFDMLQEQETLYFYKHKPWITCAIPNNQEQPLGQTRVHARIDARTPISCGHGLDHHHYHHHILFIHKTLSAIT